MDFDALQSILTQEQLKDFQRALEDYISSVLLIIPDGYEDSIQGFSDTCDLLNEFQSEEEMLREGESDD